MTTLIEYVRQPKPKSDKSKNKMPPIGVVVATICEGKIVLGSSLCKKTDRFNRKRGIKIATARALGKNGYVVKDGKVDLMPCPNGPFHPRSSEVQHYPSTCKQAMEEMAERASRYFKQ